MIPIMCKKNIMKKFIIFFLLIINSSWMACKSTVKKTISKADFNEAVLDWATSRKDNQPVELPNIYDSLVTIIAEDRNEKIILAEMLKKRGFSVIDAGRGNYPPRGPRIFSLTLQKGDCICKVDKIYYNTVDSNTWEPAERICCSDSLTYQKQ
jgi:hypothetical protein